MATLSPKHEQMLQSQFSTGRYANAEAVLELALHLLAHLDAESQTWLETTRHKIAIGVAKLERVKALMVWTTLSH